MQVNLNPSINQSRPNFKANLKVKPSLRFEQYWYKNNMTNPEFQLLKNKFSKATKDIKGNLILDFGTDKFLDCGSIEYARGKYSDKIGVNLFYEDLASDKFTEKLVKVLNFFQKRENLIAEINKLNREKVRQENRFVKRIFE